MTLSLESLSSPRPESRVLLGIVIDFSHSMRENWNNEDGKKLPRIEVIRDALNKKVSEEQQKPRKGKSTIDNIDVFCLGFGFRYPLYVEHDIHVCEEDQPLKKSERFDVIDLICDLLALGEILPTKEELSDFKEQLNQKWHQCAGYIFDQATI